MRDKRKTEPKEQYLKLYYYILSIEGISLAEKNLLAHFHSYGIKGCWESNKKLGEILFVGERSISRFVTNLKKRGLVFWVHPKGRYRTIWSKLHPEVKASTFLYYMGEQISKEAIINGHAAEILLGQNCQESIEKSVVPTETKQCVQVRQNCLHTNNTTKKDTNRRTIERPTPLPAGGQSPAALVERTQARMDATEYFKQKFGIGAKKKFSPMSEAEFQTEKQKQKQALFALNK